jgi:folate-binding protein YgfZ
LPDTESQDYRLHRISIGIADTAEIGSSELFPHEANLDQLNGVSFSKGCYVGQEVVSRMEHRGTARSRICPVHFSRPEAEAGAAIKAGEKVVGTVLATQGADGLALIRLDRLEEAVSAGDELLTHADSVHVRKPAWAKFAVAGA